MKKVMFVCTGNICRSPMAHYYMQKKVYELGRENDYYISSCGTNAENGQLATQNAVQAISEYGVNMDSHRATNIMDSDIKNFDLVITLTRYHKDIILKLFPSLQGKVFMLLEYINPNEEYLDIDDPWGYDLGVYRVCAKQIVENVDKMLDKI